MEKAHRMYPHFCDGRFYNHPDENIKSHFFKSAYAILRALMHRSDDMAAIRSWQEGAPKNHAESTSSDGLNHIRWLGHASCLVALNGVRVLIDPVFGPSTPFVQRLIPAAESLLTLPPVDAILITHNHPDHFELQTIIAIARNNRCPVFVPMGDKYWFARSGIEELITECMWWDTFTVRAADTPSQNSISITFLPAKHWSQRSFNDRNRSLWGSWMLHTPAQAIYHAGDTAYSSHFDAIAKEFNTITHALMPIGPCEPHSWMQIAHMNAEQAGQATIELGSPQLIPIHWGTFSLGSDHALMPLQRLVAWIEKQANHLQLTALRMGEYHTFMPPMASVTAPAPQESTITHHSAV